MCGITGFTHLNRRVTRERIERATASLVHRGPDQTGCYTSAHVSLGAVRLKIIDLQGGDQPMYSEDRDTVLVFNGEIYNYRELRTELEERGHRFTSHCDTELVLRAFLEWDCGAFERLRGMFAAGIWNESQRRLVLARDRLGIKPLYVCQDGQNLYFGSELKAIFAHPELDRRLDIDGLNCYLSLNYVPGKHTLVEGIEKLPPAHYLEWREGMVRTTRYWNSEFRQDPRWTLDSAKQELDRLLRESVREHLVSDVPLGIWLSGGVDSPAVLHYAAEASTAKLKTFSITFKGRTFDESAAVRQIAEIYGTDHQEMDVNPGLDLADTIEEMSYYSDEPSADAGALPVWYLSKLSRRSVTVAMSGEGADELFGGYATHLASLWAARLRQVPALVRKAALSGLQRIPVSDDKISLEYKLKRFVEGSLLTPDLAHTFWNGSFSAQQKRALFRQADARPLACLLDALPAPLAANGDLNRYLWLDQTYFLPDDILYKVDRISMAHSLEVRPPFLDHRIVEFAASLPEPLKIQGRRQKVVLRELMKSRLPRQIQSRKKVGLDIPTHDWLRGVLRPLLTDTLTREAVERAGVFDWAGIHNVIQLHLERKRNLGYHLWGLLTLFLWMKRWNIECSTETRESQAALASD